MLVPAVIVSLTIILAGTYHLPPIVEATLETYWPVTSRDCCLKIANLRETRIAERPTDWRDRDVAEAEFRRNWCTKYELPGLACEPVEDVDNERARLRWCRDREIEERAECDAQFAQLENDFAQLWKIERSAYLANIKGPDLRGRDLRRASMESTFLAGIRATGARLEGADLRWAQLEGADLRWARLDRAALNGAIATGANFSWAELEQAYFGAANLDQTNLSSAKLVGADLGSASLAGADLVLAELAGADLSNAKLKGANLNAAELTAANFSRTNLNSVIWWIAKIGPAPAHRADFTSAIGLTRDQLARVIGDNRTQVASDQNGQPLPVWSCWKERDGREFARHWDGRRLDVGNDWAPRTAAEHLERMKQAGWICPPGTVPQPTGKTEKGIWISDLINGAP